MFALFLFALERSFPWRYLTLCSPTVNLWLGPPNHCSKIRFYDFGSLQLPEYCMLGMHEKKKEVLDSLLKTTTMCEPQSLEMTARGTETLIRSVCSVFRGVRAFNF